MDLRGIFGSGDATGTGLASPLAASETSLSPAVAIAEALGLELSKLPLGRESAIQIPAVARSRNLIIGAGAPLPLVALDATGTVKRQPSFLHRMGQVVENPYDRMAWTIDDLVFHGVSLWAVERGARTGGSVHGPILDAVRVPFDAWQIRAGKIEVRLAPGSPMEPVDAADVLLFNGPTGGLLRDARETLRAAQAIERAYVDRAQNPIPLTVIRHQTGAGSSDALTVEEAQDVLAVWRNARRGEGGAVGYLPPTLVMDTPGTDAQALLQDARNAVRIDIANHVGIPVAMLDGGVAEESMTYRNAEGETSRFYRDLMFWLEPIQQRLSMDDVVPRGQRVRFDLSAFDTPAPAPTGVPTED
ncbi:hypothetical protein GCM10009846_10310 [Agrococcus versicolor]|uniref:Phage portal protein n=1 Tax=Agrococcus versicolor TaxID=501482 RepID=A0ABN3AMJ1_9MICO